MSNTISHPVSLEKKKKSLKKTKQRKAAQSRDSIKSPLQPTTGSPTMSWETLIEGTWQFISLKATLVITVSLSMLKDRREETLDKEKPSNAKLNFHLAFIEGKKW